MLVEYKNKANGFMIVGFFTWFGGNIIRGIYHIDILGWGVTAIGFMAFIYGCTLYAKAKGHHWAFGLLGAANLLGLVILTLLPDKCKDNKQANSTPIMAAPPVIQTIAPQPNIPQNPPQQNQNIAINNPGYPPTVEVQPQPYPTTNNTGISSNLPPNPQTNSTNQNNRI